MNQNGTINNDTDDDHVGELSEQINFILKQPFYHILSINIDLTYVIKM
jgi:hypothetical protein